MTRFHRSLRVSFVVALAAMLIGRWAWNRGQLEHSLDAAALPAQYVQPGVLTPEGAKYKHLFWVPGVGALRVLENRDLFDSVFPGYEAARSDAALWTRYFSELFDQTVYSAVLINNSPLHSLRISASSLGSMDIFRRYGADVLIFGISDTFIPVSTGMLRDGLNETNIPGLHDLKLLQCARGHLLPEAVSWYAQGLQGTGQKARLALWGFSLVYAHKHPLESMSHREVRNLYKNWRAENGIERFDRRFPHPSWEMFVGEGLQKRPEEEAIGGMLIPDGVAGDPKTLDEFLENGDASPYSIGHDEKDCDMSELSHNTDLALSELLRVADKVMVYIPPTSTLNRRGIPACIMPSLTAMLKSKAGPSVTVSTDDWKDYGLTNEDYLYASGKPGFEKIDPLHANDSGSRKISRGLARRISAVLSSGRP
ncbi:MAG: hypothetical protein ACHQ51_07080 [Elusimicrobiota bacterium]